MNSMGIPVVVRSFIRRLLVLALSASVLVSAPAVAQQTAQQESFDRIEGFPFPASISGHTRGQTMRFPWAGLGFGVSYSNKRTSSRADIFIYDLGKDLSSATAEDVAEQMQSELRELPAIGKANGSKYSVVNLSFGANIASTQLLVSNNDGGSAAYFIFITIATGKFVKIQYWTFELKDAEKRATRFRDDYFSRLKSRPRSK